MSARKDLDVILSSRNKSVKRAVKDILKKSAKHVRLVRRHPTRAK